MTVIHGVTIGLLAGVPIGYFFAGLLRAAGKPTPRSPIRFQPRAPLVPLEGLLMVRLVGRDHAGDMDAFKGQPGGRSGNLAPVRRRP